MRRTYRGVLAGLAAVATLAIAGCGGGNQQGNARPSVRMLATVADTPANRQLIVENQLAYLSHEAGIDLGRRALPNPRELAVESELGYGSPAGSGMLGAFRAPESRPLGYNPLAIQQEIAVGYGIHELAGLRLAGSTAGVARQFQRAGFRPAGRVGGFNTLKLPGSSLTHLPSWSMSLIEVRSVAFSQVEIATGGAQVPTVALDALLNDHQAKHPLTADPAVRAFEQLFGDDPVQVMGTSLARSPVDGIGGKYISPRLAHELLQRLHLNKLRAGPTFAGFAYLPSSPSHLQAVAAARYATPAQAATGAAVLGNMLRRGNSLSANEPYQKLWKVDSVSQHGQMVVAHLTLRRPNVLAEAIQRDDFPLFWGPPQQHH